MGEGIQNHSGSKYVRKIYGCINTKSNIEVDVYNVLDAFNVKNSAIVHAAKKLLCAGIRGKADTLQDLKEAQDALSRAIEIESQEDA